MIQEHNESEKKPPRTKPSSPAPEGVAMPSVLVLLLSVITLLSIFLNVAQWYKSQGHLSDPIVQDVHRVLVRSPLRREPQMSEAPFMHLEKGASVEKIGQVGSWAKIRTGGMECFVAAKLLGPGDGDKVKTTVNLPVRKRPVDGDILATVPRSSTVQLVQKGADWSLIRYKDQLGYVASQYLRGQ
ncbi:hypothetical protein ABB02_00568 [Clostridiaceae bacterium JG1575]|nr:hypothetical protein ABB02_00568 [Clostridiaceae bacterium JG1575]